jgi:hypothetical protein
VPGIGPTTPNLPAAPFHTSPSFGPPRTSYFTPPRVPSYSIPQNYSRSPATSPRYNATGNSTRAYGATSSATYGRGQSYTTRGGFLGWRFRSRR